MTCELNQYRASLRAMRFCDHAVAKSHKKYFRIQKSKKTAEFGSEFVRIRIRQIRNSKVPIPILMLCAPCHEMRMSESVRRVAMFMQSSSTLFKN